MTTDKTVDAVVSALDKIATVLEKHGTLIDKLHKMQMIQDEEIRLLKEIVLRQLGVGEADLKNVLGR